MLSTLKALINNYNQKTYLKNRNNINLERIDKDRESCNNIVNTEGSLEGIDKLEKDARIHNLNVFTSNYGSIRKYRFRYVSLPAILVSALLYAFTLPSKVEYEGSATKYNKETTVYSLSDGVYEYNEDVCTLGELADFFNCSLVSPEGITVDEAISDPQNKIRLKMHDYERAINASINWKSDGDLEYSSFSSVLDYLDTEEFEDINFESLDDESEFLKLFDRIVNTLKNSGYVNSKGKELIDSLSESEIKEIFITITKYENPEEISVILSRSVLPDKICFALVVLLYCVYVIYIYYSKKKHYSVYDYNVKDGYLYQENNKRVPGNLFYEALKVKEAFKTAERERILFLWEEIKNNVAVVDRGKMLTNYEKKLIKKETGEYVPKK